MILNDLFVIAASSGSETPHWKKRIFGLILGAASLEFSNLSSIWKGTDELAFEDPGFQSLSVADSLQLVHLGEGSDLFIMFIRICTLILMQGL